MESIVLFLVYALQLYIIIGVIISVLIQKKGLQQIDSSVKGAGFWFRLITFPGMVALWPIMLSNWIKALKRKAE